MTVTSSNNKIQYTGDGSTTVFPYNFKIFAQTELIVELYEKSTAITTTLALTTNYTVSGVGNSSGGNVTTISTYASTHKLIIRRSLPITTSVDYIENHPTSADTAETALDRNIMISQQLQEQIDRTVLQNSTATTSLEMPVAEAFKALAWAAGGTALENVESPGTAAASAQAAQALAETAQTAAELAETNAETAETNSAASAVAAAASAASLVADGVTLEKTTDFHIKALGVDTAQIAADAVTGAKIADDTVKEEHIELSNNAYLQGRNAANSASIDLIKVNASDVPVIPDGTETATNAAPASDNDVSNKKYVDDQISALTIAAWGFVSSATFASSADVVMSQAVGEGDVYKFIIEYEVAGGGSADNWLITDSNASSYTWSLQTQVGTGVENQSQATDSTIIQIATTTYDNFVGAEVYLEVTVTGRNTGSILMIDCVAQNTDGLMRSVGVGRHGSEIGTALHLKCGSAIMTGRYYILKLQSS